MIEPREKVGKYVYDMWGKVPESADATEQMREQLSEYDKNMAECFEAAKLKYTGDFYIVVITKKERLMQNVLRNYFFDRHTCPTPDYDQAVYKYDKASGTVEFIWVIPSKQTCLYLLNNALEVKEKELLQFALEFYDGTLAKKALILNNELEGV